MKDISSLPVRYRIVVIDTIMTGGTSNRIRFAELQLLRTERLQANSHDSTPTASFAGRFSPQVYTSFGRDQPGRKNEGTLEPQNFKRLTSVFVPQMQIDRDIALIRDIMNGENKEHSYRIATGVYAQGSFSWPYAELTVKESAGLPVELKKGETVTGMAHDKSKIAGVVLENTKKGSKSVKVEYPTTGVKVDQQCVVGGNFKASLDKCTNLLGIPLSFEGFFAVSLSLSLSALSGFAEPGTLTLPGYEHPMLYHYNKTTDNKSFRSIRGFSKLAGEKMKPCGNNRCDYFRDFGHAQIYFGNTTYADEYIVAAFSGVKHDFKHMSVDFTNYDHVSRAGTLLLVLALWLRLLTDMTILFSLSLHSCYSSCRCLHVHIYDDSTGIESITLLLPSGLWQRAMCGQGAPHVGFGICLLHGFVGVRRQGSTSLHISR